MRKLILFLSLFAISCHTPATGPSDAGPPGVRTSDRSPPQQIPDRLKRIRENGPPKPPKTPKPAPTDPYVQRCLAHDYGTEGWAGLQACLNGADMSSLDDAGPVWGSVEHSVIRPNPKCAAKLVTDWYFDPAGDDNNTCVDSGHPCVNPIEVEARWGCGAGPDERPYLTQGTQWHSHGDMAVTSAFRIHPTLGDTNNSGAFTITCDSTQIAGPLTMGTVVPKLITRLVGVGSTPALTVDFGAAAASYIGYMVVNTDRGNSVAWAKFLMPGSDGGPTTVVKMTQPVNPSGDTENNAWATGDHFTVQRPSQLWLTGMTPTCTSYGCEQFYPNQGNMPRIENCWIPKSGITATLTKIGHTMFHNSRIDSMLDADVDYFHNSLITQSPANAIGTIHLSGAISNAFAISSTAGGIPIGGAMSNISEGAYFDNDVQVSGNLILLGAQVLSPGQVECDNDDGEPSATWNIIGTVSPVGLTDKLYGKCTTNTQVGGLWLYDTNPPFGPDVTLLANSQAVALVDDVAHSPVLKYPRALTAALLSTSFADGGFAGQAMNDSDQGGYFSWDINPLQLVPPPVIWGVGNGGMNRDAGCPAGAIPTAIDGGYACGPVCPPNSTVVYDSTGLAISCSPPCGPNAVVTYDSAGAFLSCSAPSPTPGQYLQFNTATTKTVPGLVVDLEGDLGVTQSGGNITTWADQSGNGNNVTSLSTAIPYTSAGATSYMTFTGGSFQRLKAASFSLATPYDVFMVVRPAGTGSNNYLSDFGGSINQTIDFGNTTLNAFGSLSLSSGYATGVDHVVELQVGPTSKLTSDGNAGTSGTPTVSAATGLSVGNYTPGASTAYDGRYYAFVVYNHILNAGERDLVNGVLGAKYSITIPNSTANAWTPVNLTACSSLSSCPGTVPVASLAGCGTNNQILQTVSGVQTCETVSGDMTFAAGVATLASVGTAGSCGDATHSCQITFDAKGRETAETQVSITAGSVTLAGDTTGPSGSNTTSGLQAKALPVLPISGPAQYLGYTGAAWSFFSPIDVAAGTGITITGSPTKTISLTSPVSKTMAFTAFNSNPTGANALTGSNTYKDELSLSLTTTQANQTVEFFGQGSVNMVTFAVGGTSAALVLDGTQVLLVDVLIPGSNQRAPFSIVWSQTVTTAGAHTAKIQVNDVSTGTSGNANNLSLLAHGYVN